VDVFAHRLGAEDCGRLAEGAGTGACENFGCTDSPMEAKMSSSGGGATVFFGCAVVGFFCPRLVMRNGIGTASDTNPATGPDISAPSDDGAPAERGAGAGDVTAGRLTFIVALVDAMLVCVGYVVVVVVGGMVGMSVAGATTGGLVMLGDGRLGASLGESPIDVLGVVSMSLDGRRLVRLESVV
jgi:hypothetical protein